MDAAVKTISGTKHWTCAIKGADPFRVSIVNLQDSSHCSPAFGIVAEQMKANAKLIAAAPQMLEALKKIAALRWGNDGDCRAVMIAKNAIALAED